MSYYNDPSSSWPAPGRQASWEQPQPPSRSGASSTVNREDAHAFANQFEGTSPSTTGSPGLLSPPPSPGEVDRASENLHKSGMGKGFGPPPMYNSRRESMPPMGGPAPFPDYNQNRMAGPQRHHSVSEYDGARSHSASNVQGYYQNQRFAPRPNDADQMQQAKRRMAAQRERELRNYHQEQQYHRSASGSKSDRSMSPNAMSEEGRRDLIARQHRALYGENSSLYSNNNPTSNQDVRVSGAGRNPSPLAFDPFGMQGSNASGEGSVQMPPRGDKDTAGGAQEARANGNASPSSSQNPSFSLFDNTQQASRTSNSSPGGSPPHQGTNKPNGSGVAPIGTRPAAGQGQPSGAPLGKRATTPLPSPLGYKSFNASEQNNNTNATTSAPLNPSSTVSDNKGVGMWNKGPWGSTPNQGVQASVWG